MDNVFKYTGFFLEYPLACFCRLARLSYTLTESAKYLEDEILKSQDMVKNLLCRGEEQLNSAKEEIMNMLNKKYDKSKSALVC